MFLLGLRSWIGFFVALFLSQAPEFAQQYAQRLGGALDALKPIVEKFDAAAASVGLDRQAAIRQLESSSDRLIGETGRIQADTVVRYEQLKEASEALASAAPVARPEVVARHFDADVALGALENYRPAAPLTWEGGFYALVGYLFGFGGTHVVVRGGRGRKANSVSHRTGTGHKSSL